MVHISLAAEKIIDILGFPVTNSLLTSWLVMAMVIVLAVVATRRMQLVPTGSQNAAEFVIDGLLGFMTTIAGNRKDAEKFFPIVATIFLFILASNWAGALPGVGSIGFYEEVIHNGHAEEVFVPFFRTVNADLNITLAYAIIAVTLSHYFGIAALGAGNHAGKFFSFKNPITFFVGILEFISEFAKIISFSFRLFGNIFAGEVLLVIITFLVPLVAPLPFYGLELFVGLIQALIFAVLTMMFLVVATKHH